MVLPNGTTADALKHWMLPSKVSVRMFVYRLNHRSESLINKAAELAVMCLKIDGLCNNSETAVLLGRVS